MGCRTDWLRQESPGRIAPAREENADLRRGWSLPTRENVVRAGATTFQALSVQPHGLPAQRWVGPVRAVLIVKKPAPPGSFHAAGQSSDRDAGQVLGEHAPLILWRVRRFEE